MGNRKGCPDDPDKYFPYSPIDVACLTILQKQDAEVRFTFIPSFNYLIFKNEL